MTYAVTPEESAQAGNRAEVPFPDGRLIGFEYKGSDEASEVSHAERGTLIQYRPHEVIASSVGLVDILDAFRSREDPLGRVFGGVMFGTVWQPDPEKIHERTQILDSVGTGGAVPRDQPHFPLFSGVASPGTRVDISLADEAGVVHRQVTAYTDAAGNWVAPFEDTRTTGSNWIVQIEILPAAWSGMVESRQLMISFPGGDILTHEDVSAPSEGELYGVVFAPVGTLGESASSIDW